MPIVNFITDMSIYLSTRMPHLFVSNPIEKNTCMTTWFPILMSLAFVGIEEQTFEHCQTASPKKSNFLHVLAVIMDSRLLPRVGLSLPSCRRLSSLHLHGVEKTPSRGKACR